MGADEVEQAQADQGWDYGYGFVCARCVNDEALARKIEGDADEDETCDYCTRAPAAPIDTLLEAFFDGLHTEFSLAGDELAYFGGELAPTRHWEGDDLVNEYADALLGEDLRETVREAARHDDVWVERHFIEPRHDEALLDGWRRFSHEVMYRTRHVFWLAPPSQNEAHLGGGEIPAPAILDALGGLIPQVDLVHEIPAGHRLWRARTHDAEQHWTACDLGTASPTQARHPNRMSPAGIPLFYGADNPTTAIQEVARHAVGTNKLVTYAAFETTRACRVIDFTRLGPIPTIFDTDRAHLRRALMFLHEFVNLLSADAGADEHLTYVPTQIVTEYLLRVFNPERPIHGLVYSSATGRDGRCVVVDIPQTHCLDPGDAEPDAQAALRLVSGTLHANQALPSGLSC
ncbi:HEPN-associated N-terminal domain-containing protein [Streptomyces nitrosporeus]|uniref:HEPN-associated N-terminal domain-containing protein n=1 Tax=Streptomyces nitrosporeus TaxID=28894 RepID=UPI00399FE761